MLVEFPELKDDEIFLNSIDVDFNSNQLFEKWKKLGNLEKSASILSTLLGIQKSNGEPYFHIEYLMDTVYELSNEEKEENKRYWAREKVGGGSAEPGGVGADVGGDVGGHDCCCLRD